MKSQYTVQITQIDNGILVVAGCMTFAYTETEALLKDLEAWLKHPEEVEKSILSKFKGYAEQIETASIRPSNYAEREARLRARAERLAVSGSPVPTAPPGQYESSEMGRADDGSIKSEVPPNLSLRPR